jgi:hypothetical protein
MAASRLPAAPKGLGAIGKAMWKTFLGDLPNDMELDPRELNSLHRACRCADEIALLEASIDEVGVVVRGSRGQPVVNRALEEVRLMRLAESRLLATIQLSAEAAETPKQARARRAAETRWRLEGEQRRGAKAS